MKSKRLSVGLMALGVSALGGPALAALPPTDAYISVGVVATSNEGTQQYATGAPLAGYAQITPYPGSYATGSTTASDVFLPEGVASSSSDLVQVGVGGNSIGSHASLDFSWQVDGPHTGQLVPVTVSAVLAVGASSALPLGVTQPSAAGYARFSIYTHGSTLLDTRVCASAGAIECPALSITYESVHQLIYVPANRLLGALLDAGSAVGVFYGVDGTTYTEIASAFVDPIFTIDPTFLTNNPGYSLEFSPGVGNTMPSGVPEPASWAMMLLGLGCSGAAVRGSRRKLHAAR